MFENEGQETEIQSDESSEPASEAPSDEGQGEEVAAPKVAAKEQQTDSTPFHEHPRFRELVEQKNQALAAQKALEQRYSELEDRLKTITAPKNEQKDELIEHLKTIDPRFAERIDQLSRTTSTISQLQQKLEAMERQQTVQTALSKINQLHEANKVSPEIKQFINNELDRQYMTGKVNLGNLEEHYKAIHEGFKKFEEAIKRSTLEGYVPSKKADAKIPASQPKGTPAKQGPKKPQFSKDPEVARQQIVSRYLKLKAEESDSSPV